MVTVGIVHFISTQNEQQDIISYDQLRQTLTEKNVESIIVKYDAQTYLVRGTYKNAPSSNNKNFESRAPYDPQIFRLIESSDIPPGNVYIERMEGDNVWISFLTSIIPFVIIFILFFFLLNQAQGGGGKVMNFGKSKARLYNEEKKNASLSRTSPEPMKRSKNW